MSTESFRKNPYPSNPHLSAFIMGKVNKLIKNALQALEQGNMDVAQNHINEIKGLAKLCYDVEGNADDFKPIFYKLGYIMVEQNKTLEFQLLNNQGKILFGKE